MNFVTDKRLCTFFPGRHFVEETLGSKYVVGRALDFATSLEESGPASPIFFILSPGVDPLKDVENQGEKTPSGAKDEPVLSRYVSVRFSIPD